MKFLKTITVPVLVLLLAGCAGNAGKETVSPVTNVIHPEWTADAVIYEVNVRQYTKEGTFKAFEEHLPRLQELGVDILWFMPVYPIGEVERKGELGSYYSIRDYKAVNPEFGDIDDFVDFAEFSCNINIHSPRAIDKPSKLFFSRFVGATPFFFEKYFRRNIDT